MDFTNLNKACPKDNYPLPRIDTLVDSTARHQLLSFMDAFSSYNQIKMEEADQEKTSFVTSQGLFCYKVMPFGLKNAGATNQRLMNKIFTHQIRRNVQVYVDDMLGIDPSVIVHRLNMSPLFSLIWQKKRVFVQSRTKP